MMDIRKKVSRSHGWCIPIRGVFLQDCGMNPERLIPETGLKMSAQIFERSVTRSVSKNVSSGVVKVLALVVPVLACVANENGYF